MITLSILQPEDNIALVTNFVNTVYLRQGYIDGEVSTENSINGYIGKCDTCTFLTTADSVLIGTVSVVKDSARGLPMDVLYSEELAPYRQSDTCLLAEVCQFAVDHSDAPVELISQINDREISLELLGQVIRYSLTEGITHLVFTINPKHERFYQLLGGEKIGDEKSYEAVNGAPAVAYILNVAQIKEDYLSGSTTNVLLRRVLEGSQFRV